jgi:Trp repressor protein
VSTLIKSGDEISAESWQPIQEWLLKLRRIGLSVLLCHHAGLSGGQRGTTKRKDALDNVVKLVVPPDYTFEDGARFEIRFDHWCGDRTNVHEIEAKYEVIDGKGLWTWKACADAMTDRVAAFLNEGLTQREVAQTLKVGVATVNRHKQKAKLAGKLKE